MKISYPWMAVIVAAVLMVILLMVGFGIDRLHQPDTPVEAIPVNPLTAELEMANMLIDNLVSFNNLLIRDLEECEDERTDGKH